MVELGLLFGGLFRLAPEVLKWFDRKDERKHELDLFDRQIQSDKLRGDMAIQQANTIIGAAELQAIIEATKAQSIQTGIGWVDAVNSIMRPLITFWWVIVMYSVALIAKFITVRHMGLGSLDAIMQLWGPEEQAIVASIISFWFVDRSLRKSAQGQ